MEKSTRRRPPVQGGPIKIVFLKNGLPEAARRAEHQGFVPKMDPVFQKWFAGGSWSSGAPRFCAQNGPFFLKNGLPEAAFRAEHQGFVPNLGIHSPKLGPNWPILGPIWSRLGPFGPRTNFDQNPNFRNWPEMTPNGPK